MPGCGLSRSWFILYFLCLYLMFITVFCTCPSQWQEIDKACFKVYDTKKNWKDANETCNTEQTGAHLIYMEDRPETFVTSLNGIHNGRQYFVGARKIDGSWYWGNNKKVTKKSIVTLDSREYAVLQNWSPLSWVSVDGNHESYFICELNMISTPGSSSTVLASRSSTLATSILSSPSSSTASATTVSTQTLKLLPPPSSLTSSSPSSSSSSFSSFSSSSSASSTSAVALLMPVSFVALLPSTTALPSFSPSAPVYASEQIALLTPSAALASLSVTIADNSKANQTKSVEESLVSTFIQNITNLNVKESSSLKDSVDLMQNMLAAMVTSNIDSTNQNPLLASQRLDKFALRYTEYHLNETEIVLKRSNVVLHAKMFLSETSNYLFEVDEGTKQKAKVVLPKENFDQNGTSVVSIYYNNLEDVMNKQKYGTRNRFEVKSKILSTSVQPRKNKLAKNVTVGLKISTSDTRLKERKCVFWEFSTENGKDPGWSSDGCIVTRSTDEYVECSCNHLTHFAILMQVQDDQHPSNHHQGILEILTYLGLAISIIGCILTFMAYSLFTDVKSEQSQIRMNLVFVLAVAYILFLLGSAAKGHLILCIAVAAMMQLFYTSALCWMFAEGIQLYMQIIKVFNTNLKMRQVYGFAYGFPVSVLIVSLSIAGNGTGGLSSFVNDEFCWLSAENHLIWTFIVVVFLLIMGNIIILGLVMKEMKRINKPMGSSHRMNALRSNVKAFFVLAPLLGITWIMGLLCILGAGVAGLYIFTILNSTQGFFIFIFHCLRNSEIQNKLQRRVQAYEENHLKQESSNIYRRSKEQHSVILRRTSHTPSTANAANNSLHVPQKNLELSDVHASDSLYEGQRTPRIAN